MLCLVAKQTKSNTALLLCLALLRWLPWAAESLIDAVLHRVLPSVPNVNILICVQLHSLYLGDTWRDPLSYPQWLSAEMHKVFSSLLQKFLSQFHCRGCLSLLKSFMQKIFYAWERSLAWYKKCSAFLNGYFSSSQPVKGWLHRRYSLFLLLHIGETCVLCCKVIEVGFFPLYRKTNQNTLMGRWEAMS